MTHLEENLIPPVAEKSTMKIFGVGGAGIAMLAEVNGRVQMRASFAAADTDALALAGCGAPVKFHVENKLLRGLGSAGDAERSRSLAEEQFSEFKNACQGCEVVFILAGLGGGAGSGITPVLARAAREAGALVLAFVTLPFDCEGNHRIQQAQHSLVQIKNAADGVICLACDKTTGLINDSLGLRETFRTVDNLLLEGLRGVCQLFVRRGVITLHFGDLYSLLRDRHAENCFAFVEASGAARSRIVVEKILSHPLLDKGRALTESEAVIVNITGGKNFSMEEIKRVMTEVKRLCPRGKVVMGADEDATLGDVLTVTLVVARPDGLSENAKTNRPSATTVSATSSAPTISRPRRAGASKPVQGQLQLTIVSKGRFDKSEPTLHEGKDLDLPTFLRLGVVLN
jgi:cell division protein FtsZ